MTAPRDYCPRCQRTTADRTLHGPTAGPGGIGWRCDRCRLEAVDFDDATACFGGTRRNPGAEWDQIGRDLREGRPVDAEHMARVTGAALAEMVAGDPDGALFALCCELTFALWPPLEDEPSTPWHTSAPEVVGRLWLAALHGAGVAVVDALGADTPTLTGDERAAVAAEVTGARGVDLARAIGRRVAFCRDHRTRTGPEVPADVLAAVVAEIRTGDRLGHCDADGARAIITALMAAGYGLVAVA